MLGRHPRIHGNFIDCLIKLSCIHGVKLAAGEGVRPFFGDDPKIGGDPRSRQRVVACDHNSPDTRTVCLGNGTRHFGPRRVNNAYHTRPDISLFNDVSLQRDIRHVT